MRDPDAKRFVEAVPRIAGLLGAAEPGRALGTGDRAALRRLDPEAPEGGIGAVCRVLIRAGVAVERLDVKDLRRAAHALHLLALLSGSGADPHDPRLPAGRGLAEARLSEARFRRFLTARGPAFRDQATHLARFLAGRGQRLHCGPLIRLLLVEGDDEDAAEAIRLELAAQYYAALHRQSTGDAA